MTATLPPTPKSMPASRRALLAGALGGLGALAASAIGRPAGVWAGVDGDVVLGIDNAETTTTKISNLTTNQTVLWGASSSGVGVYGSSTSGVGVHGSSSYVAVTGAGYASDQPATLGQSYGNSTGVQGYSGTGSAPPARAKTGVYGYAAQDSTARGVWGESPAGRAIQGTSSSGYAGYFSGRVYTTKWYEMTEISAPSAPAANRARLFVRDSGSGKTQLCVRFPTGAVQVIKTEL
jgi:hypothetical protein